MPNKEQKKTADFKNQCDAIPLEDQIKFSSFAQFIDTAQTNSNVTLEYYLKELLKIYANNNDGWAMDFNLRHVVLLLYQRAQESQTKDNGWFLTENCKDLFKKLSFNEANLTLDSKKITEQKPSSLLGFFSSKNKTEKKVAKNTAETESHHPF